MTRKLGSFALAAAFAAALLITAVALAHSSQQPREAPSFQLQASGFRITYQGRLADPAGSPLTGAVTLTVRLYDQPSLGALTWSETHTDVQLTDGVFVVALGSHTPLQPEHVAGPRWIEISVDDGAPLLPRQPLGAAPYALLASAHTAPASLRWLARCGICLMGFVTLPYGLASASTAAARSALLASV